jgi:hypothetical protein
MFLPSIPSGMSLSAKHLEIRGAEYLPIYMGLPLKLPLECYLLLRLSR